MGKTSIVIERNKYGDIMVNVINEDLSSKERNEIKYKIYKQINESYKNLLKYLPQTDGNDK